MADLRRRVLAEVELVEATLEGLREAIARPKRSAIELAATAAFVHNTYNGMENILKQVLRSRKIEVPRGETWHKLLLERASVVGVISSGLADELLEYLTFRHFFVHGYGILLEESPLFDLARRLPGVWSRFRAEVERFIAEQSTSA